MSNQESVAANPVTDSKGSLMPVANVNRIHALDILRGFALMGILLMNIEWFNRPISEISSFNYALTGLDHAVGWLVRCFVEGKFYKLFALLFGMGFAVMLSQAIKKDRPFGAWFVRRMLVLFLFGIAHMFFLWQGDILHDYAIAGLLMLGLIYLLRKKRFEKYNNPQSILKLALWWLCIPVLLASIAGIGFGVFVDHPTASKNLIENQQVRQIVQQLEAAAEAKDEEKDGLNKEPVEEPLIDEDNAPEQSVESDPELVNEFKLTPQEQAQEIFDFEQQRAQDSADEIAALKHGSYWEATVFRTKASLIWLVMSPFFGLTMLLPIFLLGYWLIISDTIKNHAQHPKLFGYMARIGLGVGLLVTIAGLSIMSHPAVKQVMLMQGVGNILFVFGQFFMAAGYLGVVIRLLDSSKWYSRLQKLAPMGRMALTNYIMQSVICTSLFYGYAGGLYGDISRALQLLIVLLIIGVQIPLSSWWLSRYQYGPLEWLWRSLTYKKWQAFNCQSIAQ